MTPLHPHGHTQSSADTPTPAQQRILLQRRYAPTVGADRPRSPPGLTLMLSIALLLSTASPALGQVAADSAALADSAKLLSERADQAYRQGTREALEHAMELWTEVSELCRRLGDRRREGATLGNIGRVNFRLGRLDSALLHLHQALAILREVGDRGAEGLTLNIMGNVHSRLGQPDSALVYYRQALAVSRDVGDRLREAGTLNNIGIVHAGVGNADSALVYYRLALAIHRDVGNRGGEAGALGNIGVVYRELGRPDSALHYYRQSLAIMREVGDRRREGNTLGNIGIVHHNLGRPDSALVYFREALGIHREVGNRYAEGWVLTNIGETHRAVGRPDSALVYFGQALAINRELGDRRGEGTTLGNIGLVHSGLGPPDSALVYYREALGIHRGVGNRSAEATVLASIGNLHHVGGQPDSALAYYRRALAIRRAIRDRGGEAAMLGSLGNVHQYLGRADSALSYFRRTLSIMQEVGSRGGEGLTLGNIGNAYRALGHADSALIYYSQALAVQRDVGNRDAEGRTLRSLGDMYAHLGRPDSSLTYYGRALAIAREVRDRAGEGVTLNNIGTVHWDLGRPDSALVYFRWALAIEREVGEKRAEGFALRNLAVHHHRHSAQPDLERATAYFDSAAAVRASVAAHAGSDPGRLSYAEQYVGIYWEWALAWLGRTEEVGAEPAARSALAVAERGRAQALLELMRTSARGAGDAVSPVQALTTPGADLAEEGARLADAVTRSGAASLSYLITVDTLLVWLIEPSGQVSVSRRAVSRDSVVTLVRALRAGLGVDDVAAGSQLALRGAVQLEAAAAEGAPPLGRGLRYAEPAAAALARLLMPAELAARLPEAGELVIVPQGPLALVPFTALPLGEGGWAEPFGNRFAIRYAPSLATLGLAEARAAVGVGRERAQELTPAVVVGNPSMPEVAPVSGERSGLAPLPRAEGEAGWLAERLGVAPLTGAEATEGVVRRALTGSRLVHLATHGYAYSTEAWARQSFVALAPDEQHDGLLTVGEILDDPALGLAAELVTLSACQTGLGDLKEAEGTVGLQRAFLAKGARSVLVSLWSVSDMVTEELMKRFYTHWLEDEDGPSKAEALRRAQQDVQQTPGWEHPRFWAGFQLVGAE